MHFDALPERARFAALLATLALAAAHFAKPSASREVADRYIQIFISLFVLVNPLEGIPFFLVRPVKASRRAGSAGRGRPIS